MIDLNAEMGKDPQDRDPDAFRELIAQGIHFGVSQGDISEEQGQEMLEAILGADEDEPS